MKTTGSELPAGFGGRRLIPDTTCVDRDVLTPGSARSDIWSLYEVWETANRLTTTSGRVLAEYDPWLAVRNPAGTPTPLGPGSRCRRSPPVG